MKDIFWGFWKPHCEEKRPKTGVATCDAVRKLIGHYVDRQLGMTDRLIVGDHIVSCSGCHEELVRVRLEKEKREQG